MFCGDGINDIAALTAADVGLAVGATDAVIAASLYTSQGSVAGKNPSCPVWLCQARPYSVEALDVVKVEVQLHA